MADIKRLNYFTSQFLVEKDFNDEQAYHLNARRRHNRQLHTSGVADGLGVTRVSPTQVQIAVGTAIDNSGREIVLNDARTYTLSTNGSDLDVFLTVAYQEFLDPADHDTQAGVDKFTRTTERVLVQDGTATPPTDGSVIVLAKIRLGSGSVGIASNSSIDTTVRTLSTAAVAPKAINTTQLADGAVTLAKLANEVQPLAVLGANAITVNTNTTLKQITVGESHSARTDNPHTTTATQIDTQGGANQLVARINAGTGIIARSRLENTVVSGVMTFQNVVAGMEMFSNDIDPGFGVGALCVQLALDDVPTANITLSGDTNYARTIQLRSEINRNTGKFRIFVLRNTSGPPTPPPISVAVRWSAFKPQAGVSDSIGIAVNVTPNPANMISNTTQVFTATVANTTNGGVSWSVASVVPGDPPGTLSGSTQTSTTYTPPIKSGDYLVKATSLIDSTKTGTATVHLNADVTVIMTTPPSTVFRGASLAISATVINTPTTSVTWRILENNGGTLSNNTANSVTYTAPLTTAASTFTVQATSTIDPNKTANCVITVPAVSVSVNPSSATVFVRTPQTLTATVVNATDTSVAWNVSGGAANGTVVSTGPNTATYTAPGRDGSFTVNAVSVNDGTKSAACAITVPVVGVTINPTSASVIRNTVRAFTATVVNATDTSVNWNATGGTITSTGPTTANYTAPSPTGQGNFSVTATSAADSTKSSPASAITVPAVTISVSADSSSVEVGGSTIVRATINGTTNLNANWSTNGGSVSPGTGQATNWHAPTSVGDFSVTGTSADQGVSQSVTISTFIPKNPDSEGPPGKFLPVVEGPGGPGGLAKFLPVEEKVPITPVPVVPQAVDKALPPADEHTDTSAKAKSFVRPKKRQDSKLPPKPRDG